MNTRKQLKQKAMLRYLIYILLLLPIVGVAQEQPSPARTNPATQKMVLRPTTRDKQVIMRNNHNQTQTIQRQRAVLNRQKTIMQRRMQNANKIKKQQTQRRKQFRQQQLRQRSARQQAAKQRQIRQRQMQIQRMRQQRR